MSEKCMLEPEWVQKIERRTNRIVFISSKIDFISNIVVLVASVFMIIIAMALGNITQALPLAAVFMLIEGVPISEMVFELIFGWFFSLLLYL